MAQYGWTNAPIDAKNQITSLCSRLRLLLHESLVGIYLHGSLAMGCFNPDRSDIDVLVVIDKEMPPDTKWDVVRFLLDVSMRPFPIEISFLQQSHINPWKHPAPFELHYSEEWRHRYLSKLDCETGEPWADTKRVDPDLAAHIVILRHRGVVLYGPPVDSVFPTVPEADYIDAIVNDIDDAIEWIDSKPVYGILNLCRVLCYLEERQVTSKEEAGEWAFGRVPDEFRSVVRLALQEYRDGTHGAQSYDRETLTRFADHCLDRIRTLRTARAPEGPITQSNRERLRE